MDWYCKRCGALERDFNEVILTCNCKNKRPVDVDNACKVLDALFDRGISYLSSKSLLRTGGINEERNIRRNCPRRNLS